ncbi:hypothetical protein FRC11_012007, partial [Ceratobasidium sp. 423]
MRFLRRNPPNLRSRPGDEQRNGENTGPEGRAYSQNQVPYGFKHRRAFDPMAADRFGEELAPDAAIWSVYLDEAEEHDNELVQSRQESLDTLLLFAALFSAILTAFLVESKNLLQQDPTEVSVGLLLAIAQSQQRLELGLPVPQAATTLVNIPSFEPSWSARWVNGIWFTSLGFSLSAALMAMLGKEWLAAYLRSRPRSSRKLAFIRQSRLQGLEDWWALHIIALLPTLLHASLLLFSVGLVIYLWDYDVVLAAILTGVIGFTLLFYVITGILGAIYEFCPFVTEISGYTRKAAMALFNLGGGEHNESTAPSVQDLRALLWLSGNARDPVVVDYSYQAMAGLHASLYIKPTGLTAQLNSDVGPGIAREEPIYINHESTLTSLLETVITRFNELLGGTLETGTSEPPVSRYINAMLGLAMHEYKLTTMTPIPWFDVLYTIDLFWSSNLPSHCISGNTFTHILITKQEVMQLVAKELSVDNSGLLNVPACSPNNNTLHTLRHSTPVTNNGHTVDMHKSSTGGLTLVDLHKMFTQWLDMSMSLVRMNSQGDISIDSYLLEALNRAMGDAAYFLDDSAPKHNLDLVPGNISSDHMNSPAIHSNPNLNSFTSSPTPLGNSLDNLGELVSTLLNIVRAGPKPAAHVPTLKIYNMLTPITLRRLYNSDIDVNRIRQLLNFQDLESNPPLSRRDILYTVVRYAMVMASYTYNIMSRHPRAIKIFDDALDAVYYATEQEDELDFENGGPLGAIGHHLNNYISILEFASDNESNFSLFTNNTAENLCIFASYKVASNTYSCVYYVPPLCTHTLLRLLAATGQLYSSTVRGLLEALITRMRTSPTDYTHMLPLSYSPIPPPRPSIEYLQQWTHSEQIFSSMIRTASISSKYIQPVLDCLTAIVQLAANRDPKFHVDPIELKTPAVRGFLQAIAWALPQLSSRQGEEENYHSFVAAVSILLAKAAEDGVSRKTLVNDQGLGPLFKELEPGKGNNIESLSQEEWEKLVYKLA